MVEVWQKDKYAKNRLFKNFTDIFSFFFFVVICRLTLVVLINKKRQLKTA